MAVINKRFLVVGDEGCGKTSLLNAFHEEHCINTGLQICPQRPPSLGDGEETDIRTCVPMPPPGFVSYYSPVTCEVDIDGRGTEFTVEEAPSQEHYSMLRTMAYEDKDVIVLCFSFDSPSSLKNIFKCWIPEIKQYCPNAPIILVGNKEDLQNDEVIKSAEGRAVAEKINALAYIECSAKTKKGVCEVFETGVRGGSFDNVTL